jgi:hypothetical protein
LSSLASEQLSLYQPAVSAARPFALVGGGAKYSFSKHFGVRGQLKYSPLTSHDHGGYWCDPFWGGCWVVGNDHFLHEFDMTGGITFPSKSYGLIGAQSAFSGALVSSKGKVKGKTSPRLEFFYFRSPRH